MLLPTNQEKKMFSVRQLELCYRGLQSEKNTKELGLWKVAYEGSNWCQRVGLHKFVTAL